MKMRYQILIGVLLMLIVVISGCSTDVIPYSSPSYYGGMWFHNDSGIVSTFNSSFKKVYFNHSDFIYGFTFLNSTLTNILSSGVYQVNYDIIGVGLNNHEYHSYVFVNELLINSTLGHTVADAVNQVSMSGLGFIRLEVGDNISLRIADMTSSSTGTQISSNLNIVKIAN